MPTTYLKRLYFDALVYTHHQLQYLVDEYGADHILVGTDYPADMGEIDPIGFIERCPGLDDDDAPRHPRRQRRPVVGAGGAGRRPLTGAYFSSPATQVASTRIAAGSSATISAR